MTFADCVACGYQNPLMANYCAHCGRKIVRYSENDKITMGTASSTNPASRVRIFALVETMTSSGLKTHWEQIG